MKMLRLVHNHLIPKSKQDLNRVQNRLLEIKFNNFHIILGFKTCFAANLHQSSRIKIANYFRDLSYFYVYPHI